MIFFFIDFFLNIHPRLVIALPPKRLQPRGKYIKFASSQPSVMYVSRVRLVLEKGVLSVFSLKRFWPMLPSRSGQVRHVYWEDFKTPVVSSYPVNPSYRPRRLGKVQWRHLPGVSPAKVQWRHLPGVSRAKVQWRHLPGYPQQRYNDVTCLAYPQQSSKERLFIMT